MYQKTTFKNGLRIITVPQEQGTEAVTVLVLAGTGSKYEEKKLNGISHFLEHLFFKGTKKRPTSLAISETLDGVGGIYNAFTSEEYTGYFAKVDSKYLDLALDVVSDIFLNSKLEPIEIEKEKKVIFEEINMQYDHPTSHIQLLWNELLYGDQPSGWNIAGTKESVAGIFRQDLINYRKRQYTAQNTIVSVAGKIKDKDRLNKKIETYFSKIGAGKPKEKSPVSEKQSEPQCLLKKKETDQTHLCFGVRGYNLFHPLRYAQELLGVVLGGMMSSRLFIEVREKLGLAYYIQTSIGSDTDTGFLVTQAGVDNKNAEKAISTILKEYKKLSRIKIPAEELKKAKEYIKGKTTLLLEASDAKASFFAMQDLLERRILTQDQIYAKIDKVTASDILRVARDIFQPHKLNLALLGPFESQEKFQKLLKL